MPLSVAHLKSVTPGNRPEFQTSEAIEFALGDGSAAMAVRSLPAIGLGICSNTVSTLFLSFQAPMYSCMQLGAHALEIIHREINLHQTRKHIQTKKLQHETPSHRRHPYCSSTYASPHVHASICRCMYSVFLWASCMHACVRACALEGA